MRKQIEGRLDLTSFVPVDLVVRFVRRVSRVSRVCPVCVPAPPGVCPGSPRCLFTLLPVDWLPRLFSQNCRRRCGAQNCCP
jgi:hypothetical protein